MHCCRSRTEHIICTSLKSESACNSYSSAPRRPFTRPIVCHTFFASLPSGRGGELGRLGLRRLGPTIPQTLAACCKPRSRHNQNELARQTSGLKQEQFPCLEGNHIAIIQIFSIACVLVQVWGAHLAACLASAGGSARSSRGEQ